MKFTEEELSDIYDTTCIVKRVWHLLSFLESVESDVAACDMLKAVQKRLITVLDRVNRLIQREEDD